MTDDQRYMLLQHAIYEISKEPMKVGTTVGDWINSLNNQPIQVPNWHLFQYLVPLIFY